MGDASIIAQDQLTRSCSIRLEWKWRVFSMVGLIVIMVSRA